MRLFTINTIPVFFKVDITPHRAMYHPVGDWVQWLIPFSMTVIHGTNTKKDSRMGGWGGGRRSRHKQGRFEEDHAHLYSYGIMVQNNQESRRKHWATRPSVHCLLRTAHFARALLRSFTCSLSHSLARGKVNDYDEMLGQQAVLNYLVHSQEEKPRGYLCNQISCLLG